MKISLYIHIPFCIKKCLYCDFLSGPCDDRTRNLYVENLLKEIKVRGRQYREYEVISIFFGGGTPSILSGEAMRKLLNSLRESFCLSADCEITVEVNPGTVSDADKLFAYKDAGINRLSIGLQSTHNAELKLLGRIHTYEDFLDTWSMVRASGFKNVNVDLMSGLPGQRIEDFTESLERVKMIGEPLKHISVYSLILEEGTPFFEQYTENDIDEDLDRELYALTGKILSDSGFNRYEISNYSLKGYECRHNLVYWDRGNYLGLGLGASSMVKDIRWKNGEDLDQYMKFWTEFDDIVAEDEDVFNNSLRACGMIENYSALTLNERMEEFMFLGLRKIKGVQFKAFKDSFGEPMPDKYQKIIDKFIVLDLMKRTDDSVMLTDKGLDVSNTIMSEFLF